DLVVVDDRLCGVRLPELVHDIVASRSGVIVLSSDGSELATVLLIEHGADDVVLRPYSQPELRARMHAILRRRAPRPATYATELTVGPICLNTASRLVTVRGSRLHLPRLEFAVLLALQTRDGAPVSRGVLLQECWSAQTTRRP